MPIARGGFSDKKNCVPSCKKCNTEKGYKTRAELAMEEFNKQSNLNGDETGENNE